MLFFSYANYRSSQRINARLESSLYNTVENLNIKITSIPIQKDYGLQFEADVINLSSEVEKTHIKHILINTYESFYDNQSKQNEQNNNDDIKTNFIPKVGEVWKLPLKLKPPYANQNPYIFDYEFYLFHNNIHALASLNLTKQASNIVKIKEASIFDFTFIEQTRFYIQNKITPFIQNLKWKNVIIALIIGNQSQISTDEWNLFNNSGIGHLISISGLHITMIALFASSLPLFFMKRYPQMLFYIDKRYVCGIVGLIFSGIYTLISGAQIPAQRTWIMLCIMFFAYVRLGLTTSLMISALIIMLLDPWCVGSASFWLSFGAVGIMIFIGTRITKIGTWRTSKLWLITKAQLAISLAMIPISIFIFSKFSLVSPLANAVAIPIISYIISPLLLLSTFLCFILPEFIIIFLFKTADFILDLVMVWCSYICKFAFAYGDVASPSIFIFVISLIGSICLILPYKWRWYGLVMFIPLFLHKNAKLNQNEALITFFDVGQGSSVLISTANHHVLFDIAQANGKNVVADKIIIPSIKQFGIHKLDKLLVSHSDKDHSGGLNSILKSDIKIDELVVGIDLNHDLLTDAKAINSIKLEQCKPDTWEYDGVSFAVLYPLYNNDFGQKTNYNSCVLKIMAGATSLLLTADIEKPQEYILGDTYKELLKSDVMLAPHHGSKTSSTIDFLNLVQPKDIIIQAGFLNMYKHPHKNVLDNYASINSNVYRTDKHGAIQVIIKQNSYEIIAQKIKYKRYWGLDFY
jgi:competence protein ComEC